ncbi:MAG TPA: DUF4397 domain-containing protein [Bacteroidetes bacterium]|nr:DUF4397 domain-containing protein [Bacteroidota bacterium]
MKMEPRSKAPFTLLGVLLIALFAISSCVKIPTEAPPLPKFKAKLRIIHAATDVGEVAVKLDGQNLATLSMEGASPYVDVDAGKHAFQVGSEDVDSLFVDTDFVGTFYIAAKAGGNTKRLIKKRERWMFNPPAPKDTAAVVFAQMSPDGAYDILWAGSYSGSDTSYSKNGTLASGLAFTKFAGGFFPVTGWSYTFYVTDGTDTLLTVNPTISSGKSVTEVLMNNKANLKVKEFANE